MAAYQHHGVAVNQPLTIPDVELFDYTAEKTGCKIKDTMDWTRYEYIVRSIDIDAKDISLDCDDHAITIWWIKDDPREKEDMDTGKCFSDPEGCCFEHTTCGNSKCLEHDPLQELKIECELDKLIGKRIVGFVVKTPPKEYMIEYHKFAFILASGEQVDLSITNSTTNSNVSWSYDFYFMLSPLY